MKLVSGARAPAETSAPAHVAREVGTVFEIVSLISAPAPAGAGVRLAFTSLAKK